MHIEEPVRHLLIDLDGTLLGNRNLALSLDFVTQALQRLKKYGGWRKAVKILLAINQEFKKKKSGVTNDNRIVELFAKQANVPLDEGRRFLKESIAVIFSELGHHFYPIDGAKDFLDWAKLHFPLTLATNPVWPSEIIELRVRWAGIDPAVFQYITHVTKMHACKPEREYYEEILSQIKHRAEECLLVGNDLKMDLPATHVGIRTYIVGSYKRMSRIKPRDGAQPGDGGCALAWKGSFPLLRSILEHSMKSW